MENPILTRAQRRQSERDIEPVLLHSPQGFQGISKGADNEIWQAVEAELEKSRLGIPDTIFQNEDDQKNPKAEAENAEGREAERVGVGEG
jgi:hypothetical protein